MDVHEDSGRSQTAADVITRVSARVVAVPVGRKVATPVGDFSCQHYVVVTVETGEASGEAYGWTFHEPEAAILRDMVTYLGKQAIGMHARDLGNCREAMRAMLRLTGRTGIGMFAFGILDTALWDLLGRTVGLPLWSLLGGTRPDRVPCYASQALFLTASVEELTTEADALREAGYKTVKMRVGLPEARDDERRVSVVRDAIGPDVDLMLDAVMAWDVPTAERTLRRLAAYDPLWIEDPVDYHEGLRLQDLKRVRMHSSVPVAAGEFLYEEFGHEAALSAEAVDYLIVDLQRAGGVSGWRAVCEQAGSRAVPIASHVFPEVAVHLYCCARQKPVPIEYLPWSTQLSRTPLVPEHGSLPVPMEPGVGFAFDWSKIADLTVGPVREA